MQGFRLSKPHKTKQKPVLDRHEMQVNVAGYKTLPTDFAKGDSTLQISPTKGNEGLIVMPREDELQLTSRISRKGRLLVQGDRLEPNLLSAECTNQTQLNTGQTIQILPQTQSKILIQTNSHLHFDICSIKLFLVVWILTWKDRP